MKISYWAGALFVFLVSACGESTVPPAESPAVPAVLGTLPSPPLGNMMLGSFDVFVVQENFPLGNASIFSVLKFGGTLQRRYQSSGSVRLIGVDEQNIYFVETNGNSLVLKILTIADGKQRVVASTPQYLLFAAIDDTHVYYGRELQKEVQIERIAKNGVNAEIIGKGPNDLRGLVVDDTSIFGYSARSQTIWKLGKTGGFATTIANADPENESSAPSGFVADDTHLYYFDQFRGVTRLPKSGGQPQLLAKEEECVQSIAVGATDVYWSCNTNARLKHVKKTGGAVQTVNDSENSDEVAVDENRVFWTTYDEVKSLNL